MLITVPMGVPRMLEKELTCYPQLPKTGVENHTAKVTQSELRHNVELACTPIYSGSATPKEHRVVIHCATRGSVIPGAGVGQKGAGHHNQQAGCRPGVVIGNCSCSNIHHT